MDDPIADARLYAADEIEVNTNPGVAIFIRACFCGFIYVAFKLLLAVFAIDSPSSIGLELAVPIGIREISDVVVSAAAHKLIRGDCKREGGQNG
jgi:hypothetical protein